ncbi:MAG: two-component regulator propeller domain-containing protein [Saprospiraceae bacterium]
MLTTHHNLFKIPLILITLIFGLPSVGHTQNVSYRFQQFSVHNGLPSQVVYNILEDQDGFLWICTDAGISRFDGNNFRNFTTFDSLGENEILEMYRDSKNRIWFSPFYGNLSYYQNGRFNSPYNNSFVKNIKAGSSIRHFIEDNHRNIFLNTDSEQGNVFIIDSNDQFRKLDSPNTFNNKSPIVKISLLSDLSALFTTADNHLFQYKDNNFVPYRTPFQKEFSVITSSDARQTYFLTADGIYDNKNFKLLLPIQKVPEPKFITSINRDQHQNIWMSHSKLNTLVYVHQNGQWRDYIPILKDIQANICFDQSSNCWLCSSTSGLFRIPLDAINEEEIYLNEHLIQQNVISSCLQSDGSIWLGYTNGFTTRIQQNKIQHISLGRGTRQYNRLLDIQESANKMMYFILDEGGCRIAPNQVKPEFQMYSKQNGTSGKGLVRTPDGQILYGYARTLSSHDTMDRRFPVFHNASLRRFSHFINKSNNLYISSSEGIFLVKDTITINLSLSDPRLNCRVNKFIELANGDIVCATHGDGVIILRDNQIFQQITKSDGLSGFICRNITQYNDTLYVATNEGISVITQYAEKYQVIQKINVSVGLAADDVNSVFIKDNKLYATTSRGISILSLRVLGNTKLQQHPVILLSSTLNGQQVDFKHFHEIAYSQNHIQITYISPNLSQDKSLSYRYRILPLDKTWTETHSNSIDFVNLLPNHYKIEIQSRFSISDWSPSTVIIFSILPPFYQTRMFYLISALVLAGLIYFIARQQIRQKYARELQDARLHHMIHQERDRIASDIHDDIGAELTHLVLLTKIIKDTDQPERNTLLAKLEKVANELLNKMNEVIWALNPSNDNMANFYAYLKYYVSTFLENHMLQGDLNFEGESLENIAISAEIRRNTFLVIKEFLNNTLKHASATHIHLQLQYVDQCIQVNISDNGIGLPDEKDLHLRNGILNMKKRILQCKGTFEFTKNDPNGLSLSFTIPLTQS